MKTATIYNLNGGKILSVKYDRCGINKEGIVLYKNNDGECGGHPVFYIPYGEAMIVFEDHEEPKFQPVTITIESEEELLNIWHILKGANEAGDKLDEIVKQRNIYK